MQKYGWGFIDRYMANEPLFTWSALRGRPPPPGYKPLSSYRLADDYRGFLVDAPLVDELRRRFLAYTGPVVNRT